MDVFCLVLVGLVTFLGLGYLRAPLYVWTITLLLSVAALHTAFWPPIGYSLWVILTPIALILNIGFFRRKWCVGPFMHLLKKKMPPISQTEQEAISSGDVWIEGELFRGSLDWQNLLSLPKSKLTEAESNFLNQQVEALCDLIDNWKMHENHDLAKSVWSYLKKECFFGMIIPKAYGGLEFSAFAHSTIIQKIATRNMTAAVTAMVPNSLGPAELLLAYGTEEQKNHYLPRLATGQEIPCFALTSPEVGSDAGGIIDTGIVCRSKFNGQETLGIKLNWDKRYITLAPIATVMSLVFKLYDPEQLLEGDCDLGFTIALIPTAHPGVKVGHRHIPMNQPLMNGPVRGKDVFIPLDWIIGGPEMIGKGWKMLMECLSVGRCISLPAISSASIKVAYRTTGAYARIRKQFHLSIGRFEGVQTEMAQIAGLAYLSEASRRLGLVALDQGVRPAIVSAIAKYHITEMSRTVINKAMDVHGGRGIMFGPSNYLSDAYEYIPVGITVEGANILTRSLIIFGQGAVRCHPYIQKEILAINNEDSTKGMQDFDKILGEHIQYTLFNLNRSFLHSMSGGWFCKTPNKPKIKWHCQQVSRMSIQLALVSDLALIILGGKLKRKEALSARLGDVLSYLYLACSVIKYQHDFGNEKEDLLYLDWCLKTCLYRVQEALIAFFQNFPVRFVGVILRLLVFPFGRAYTLPTDREDQLLAVSMLAPGAFRERIAENCYLGEKHKNPIAQLEFTLHQMQLAEPELKKIEKAIKLGLLTKDLSMEDKIRQAVIEEILTDQEAEILEIFEKARCEAIQVDEFTQEQLHRS